MPPLKAEPPAPVRSLGEFFAIAAALEAEAAAHYADLASRMRGLGLPTVAAVFDRLVAEEDQHAAAIARWSQDATGGTPDRTWLRWQPAHALDEEAAQAMASSRLASAYRALSLAVRNEEQAFILWTYIAAQAEDPEVRSAAEAIAVEELRHAAMLRQERRRAFHAERRVGAGASLPATPAAAARAVEMELVTGLAALAQTPSFAAAAAELRLLAANAATMASDAESRAPDRVSPAPTEAPSLAAVQRLAERAAELYLAAADGASDQGLLLHLQSRAHQAIARIAQLAALARDE